MSESPLIIRAAVCEDAAALLDIYTPYVTETAITFEHEAPAREVFAERIARTLTRYPWLVAESGGIPIGYAYVGAFHERPAYDWAVETSIYVDQRFRRAGIGRALHDTLEQVLALQGILNLNACIACPRQEDEYLTFDSIRFHEKLGYQTAGHFHQCGFKFHRWYDMVWMEKIIGSHQPDQLPIRTFPEILRDPRLPLPARL